MTNQQFSLRKIYRDGDRIMSGVLLLMLFISLGISGLHDTKIEGVIIGIPSVIVPVLLMMTAPGRRITRVVVATALMIFSALLIHQTHGLIEMHFTIFVLLAFLLYYRDWLPIATAAAVIAVHHLAFNYLQSAGAPV